MASVRRGYRFTEAEKDRAVERYLAGETPRAIAASMGCSDSNIRDLVIRRGVRTRSHREAHNRHAVNHAAFDDLTPSARYWAGFLFADGSIARPERVRSASLRLSLAQKDQAHVFKFRTFLGSTHRVFHTRQARGGLSPRGALTSFVVRSDRLVQRLTELGMSHHGPGHRAALDLAKCRHFWRGVVDGDGSLGIYSRGPSLHLCGHRPLIEQYADFISGFGFTRAQIRPWKSIVMHAVSGTFAGRQAVQVLYGGDPADYLDRKMAIAQDIMAGGGQMRLPV